MTYSVKKYFTPFKAKERRPAGPQFSVDSLDVTFGRGREVERSRAICQFCDTDFVGTDGDGGGKFESAEALSRAIDDTWQGDRRWTTKSDMKYVVMTGGEPLLQLDAPLIAAVKARGFQIAIETNGTLEAPTGIDWICVSPKGGSRLVQRRGQELKLVYPQEKALPRSFEHLEFENYFLQPMDGLDRERNTQLAVSYCLENPRWRVSLQTHKLMRIP